MLSPIKVLQDKAIEVHTWWGWPLPEALLIRHRINCKNKLLYLQSITEMVESGYGTAKIEPNFHDVNGNACLCCGKSRRDMEYHSSVGGYLCIPCKDKVMTATQSGCVDPQSLLVAMKMYQREAEKSRKANAAYDAGPHSALNDPVTVCPRCKSANDVYLLSSKTGQHYCNNPECRDTFTYKDGRFSWQEGQVKCTFSYGKHEYDVPEQLICDECLVKRPVDEYYSCIIKDLIDEKDLRELTLCETCMTKHEHVYDDLVQSIKIYDLPI